MDHWTELAWEAERDEADAYQAAADAAEGERLRAALTKPRWVDLFGIDPKYTEDQPPTADERLAAVLRLHKPTPMPDPEWAGQDWCNECGHAWPCPTADAATGVQS